MSSKCKYCGAEIVWARTGFKVTPMRNGQRHSCIPPNRELEKAREHAALEAKADKFLARRK